MNWIDFKKEEPVARKEDYRILVWSNDHGPLLTVVYSDGLIRYDSTEITHWAEIEPPPKPDPFEVPGANVRSEINRRIKEITSKPLRTCRTLHHCCICDLHIFCGQQYYDGGYERRVHIECVYHWETMKSSK